MTINIYLIGLSSLCVQFRCILILCGTKNAIRITSYCCNEECIINRFECVETEQYYLLILSFKEAISFSKFILFYSI